MPKATTNNDLRDEWLVVRCRRHDDDAWSELIDRYHDRLAYFVRRLIDGEEAEVVLQETWLAVMRGLRTLRSGDRFAPWIYAVARNQAMLRLRRQYREAVVAWDEADLVVVDNAAERFDDAEAVHAALAEVSLVHREMLTLFFLDDLSLDEISQLLAVPLGTVKSRLHRAKAELATRLQAEVSR